MRHGTGARTPASCCCWTSNAIRRRKYAIRSMYTRIEAASASSNLRQDQRGAQAAIRAVHQGHVAAMGSGYRAGDRQAQACAAGVPAARAFQAVEGGEHLLLLRHGDAGAVVVDPDGDIAGLLL